MRGHHSKSLKSKQGNIYLYKYTIRYRYNILYCYRLLAPFSESKLWWESRPNKSTWTQDNSGALSWLKPSQHHKKKTHNQPPKPLCVSIVQAKNPRWCLSNDEAAIAATLSSDCNHTKRRQEIHFASKLFEQNLFYCPTWHAWKSTQMESHMLS